LVVSTTAALFIAMMVFVIRMRESKKPTTLKKIILPPFFMMTGYSMFLYPPMHVQIEYAIVAFLVGVLLSYPLIVTSQFEVVENEIYLKRSKLFIMILFGLVLLRLVLREYVSSYIDLIHTSSLFFIMANGMILPWRISMFFGYKKIQRNLWNSFV
jgi:membrane protein CcdC involved in cytochrome C biogenesis